MFLALAKGTKQVQDDILTTTKFAAYRPWHITLRQFMNACKNTIWLRQGNSLALVSIQKSPIIHLFAKSIAGAVTIRGFGQEKRFMKRNIYLLDCFVRSFFYSLVAIDWLCLRIELLSTFVFAFCIVLLVSFPPGSIDPTIALELYLQDLCDQTHEITLRKGAKTVN